MRNVLAIAGLTLRSAIRSRAALSVAVVLVLLLVSLGVGVKGDGTAGGRLTVLLYYSLGLSSVVLGAVTLWLGCAVAAGEISGRHIQLLVTKPVHAGQIWAGKWLGLVALDALLLALVGALVYAMALRALGSVRPGTDERSRMSEILMGRRQVRPDSMIGAAQVERRLAHLREQGQVPAGIFPAGLRRQVEAQLSRERAVLPPGQSREWRFQLPPASVARVRKASGKEAERITLGYYYYSTIGNRMPIQGRWRLEGSGASPAFEVPVKREADGPGSVSIPARHLGPGDTVTLRFENDGPGVSNTLVFDPDRMVLLVPETSFADNEVRALLAMLCLLGLLAALGVTAGTVFSFPVASFAAASLAGMVLASHYFAGADLHGIHSHEEPVEPSAYFKIANRVAGGLDWVLGPVFRVDPAGRLSDGVLITGGELGTAFLAAGIGYPMLLALMGSAFLRRRELGLPPS